MILCLIAVLLAVGAPDLAAAGNNYILVSDIIEIFHEYPRNPQVRKQEFGFLWYKCKYFNISDANL